MEGFWVKVVDFYVYYNQRMSIPTSLIIITRFLQPYRVSFVVHLFYQRGVMYVRHPRVDRKREFFTLGVGTSSVSITKRVLCELLNTLLWK